MVQPETHSTWNWNTKIPTGFHRTIFPQHNQQPSVDRLHVRSYRRPSVRPFKREGGGRTDNNQPNQPTNQRSVYYLSMPGTVEGVDIRRQVQFNLCRTPWWARRHKANMDYFKTELSSLTILNAHMCSTLIEIHPITYLHKELTALFF